MCISTPTIMLGYLDNPEETNKVIEVDKDGNKWVHTGDIAYIDEDGCIFIIDRMKRMIIRPDGHNVFPSQIENVIMSSNAVEKVAVVGRLDDKGSSGKWPVAYIVLKNEYDDNKELIRKEIIDLMNKTLPERDKTEEIFFIDDLPLTPIGKVDYRKLEEMYETV